MKTLRIIPLLLSFIMVSAFLSSCEKDDEKVACFVYADKTSTPMPDELHIKISATDYEPLFVPSDGTKPVLYDGSHPINYLFDNASTGHDKFVYAGLFADKFGLDGWCFGFKAKPDTQPGYTDMVTLVYDQNGVTIMKRVKLVAVE